MIEIKSRTSLEVIFRSDKESIREAVEEAVKNNVNLAGANLYDTNLSRADLEGANLLCRGDMKIIHTMQLDSYTIGFTKDTLQIGFVRIGNALDILQERSNKILKRQSETTDLKLEAELRRIEIVKCLEIMEGM